MADPGGYARGARAAALVTQMAVSTAVLAWLGRYADARFHTAPWLLALGAFGGFAVGMFTLIRGLGLAAGDDEPPPDPPQ